MKNVSYKNNHWYKIDKYGKVRRTEKVEPSTFTKPKDRNCISRCFEYNLETLNCDIGDIVL